MAVGSTANKSVGTKMDWHINHDDLEHELSRFYHAIVEAGREYASKEGLAKQLYDRGKDIIEDIKVKLIDKNNKLSNPQAEMYARAAENWKIFKDGYHQAQADALSAKIKYEVACRGWESVRTLMANKREEIKHSIGG